MVLADLGNLTRWLLIFDNAINAGGASNWTAYDGC